MEYIYIYFDVKPDKKVTHDIRNNYLLSLFGNYYKVGQVVKFNNEIGFKPVIMQFEQPGRWFPPEINVEETYMAPSDVLFDGVHVVLGSHSILKFEIPVKQVICKVDSRFSYHTMDICKRFVKFANKVYPDLVIKMEVHSRKIRTHLVTFVIDYFYRNLDFHKPIHTVELSSHRLLTDKEIEFITKKVKSWVSYPFHINQYYCQTCAEYNAKTPYHIEIVYDKVLGN